MIINTGMRTDIPAFYSEWLINRIRQGFVLVRDPFRHELLTRYKLDPEVVDILAFCTKNPDPMLRYMNELKKFRQFWFVTVTPYGKDIEPNVPDKNNVLESFRWLSGAVGKKAVSLRYDPILISDKYSIEYHIRAFDKITSFLEGYTDSIVISFIDLYTKTKRNFPEAREVTADERKELGKAFVRIGEEHGMIVRSCVEGIELSQYGIDVSGCMTKEKLEQACDIRLDAPKKQTARKECACLLGSDIGAYNTCLHFCRYCYANYDKQTVMKNFSKHDPDSPLLIGNIEKGDIIRNADQYSYLSDQLTFF